MPKALPGIYLVTINRSTRAYRAVHRVIQPIVRYQVLVCTCVSVLHTSINGTCIFSRLCSVGFAGSGYGYGSLTELAEVQVRTYGSGSLAVSAEVLGRYTNIVPAPVPVPVHGHC